MRAPVRCLGALVAWFIALGGLAPFVAPVHALPRPGGAAPQQRDTGLSILPPGELAAAKERAGHGPTGGSPVAPHPKALAPSSPFGFDAIFNRPPLSTPADPSGAVGLTRYVTAVNVHVAVYDRTGVVAPSFATPVRLLALSSYPFPRGTDDYDPKVVYDPYTDHFMLVFLAINDARQRSWITIATVPDATADDLSTWCVSTIPADQTPKDGNQWADYPGLGFDGDRVAVTTNQFTFADVFKYSQILSFPKSKLYDCSMALTFKVFAGDATRAPDGSRGFTIQPAVTNGGATPPLAQYFLSFDFTGTSGSNLVLWRLKVVGGVLRLLRTELPVGRALIANFGTQGNGKLNGANSWWDTGDLRLTTAFYDADLNKVYAAHAVQKDIPPSSYIESAIRWYEVEPAGAIRSSTVARKGIIGTSASDAAWPAVATNGLGNLVVTYSQASAVTGEFLSQYVAEVAPESTAFTPLRLIEGTGRYEASVGVERWGDFNSIERDPTNPNMLVVVSAIPVGDGVGPTPDWQEHVDVVSFT